MQEGDEPSCFFIFLVREIARIFANQKPIRAD